ncbi:MAG: PEP/pyruvate-binding domain-containing protein [Anaerolineales bacterium]
MKNSSILPSPLIPFDSSDADLETVGGKGLNLVRLFSAGLSVPDGFIIPTSAYHTFVEENQLREPVLSICAAIDHTSPVALEAASDQIRTLFSQGKISASMAEALEQGWISLGSSPVAVRSSATAEDLPDMSFAGQQDTFLNISTLDGLQKAVIQCWSSLWTARAIGYRQRNAIPHGQVSLSVIVQQMVESESSGVMFTVNPLTGLRREVVIDATLGLGEALVSGQVEPDHYVVDSESAKITGKTLGTKAVLIQGQEGGGVTSTEEDRSAVQALPDEAILQLSASGKQIEHIYGFPQDIEWAWMQEKLYILQSRPITSLYPIPERGDDPLLRAYFSFGAVQGILDPLTPLGQDAIRLIFSGGASLFGFDHDHHTQKVIWSAGERLWGDVTSLMRHPIGAKAILKVFPGVEPGSVEAMKTLLADPAMEGGKGKIRLDTLKRFRKFLSRIIRKARQYFHEPEEAAVQIKEGYEQELKEMAGKFNLHSGQLLPLLKLPELFGEIRNSFIYAVPEIVPGILVGLLPMLILNKFSKELTGSSDFALELTRGLPNNVTTEMDITLWQTAQKIRTDQTAFQHLSSTSPEILAEEYLQHKLPAAAQTGISSFMDIYGMRGLGEIDFGRPRWRENPTPVMKTIQSYLQIEDPDSAPDVIFQRGAQKAQEALDQLVSGVEKTFGGKLKARIAKGAARRLRSLGGLRESPKFYIIQRFGLIREVFLQHGEQLVQQGHLKQREDLFFLTLDELDSFVRDQDQDWIALIAERRQTYDREMRRRQIPRLLVSDGRTFYDGIGSADASQGQFKGSPVSPGTVEGTVRVVLDPHNANLSPGEILVCPGTDPAWTPLFLLAGGLVMEVGGLMTHGAIVAREYGIPAVVGVNSATEILQTGDRIRIDGSTGIIERC